MLGGILGCAFETILFEVADLVDSCGPFREWGDTATRPMNLLQVLLKVGGYCSLRKKELQAVAVTVG